MKLKKYKKSLILLFFLLIILFGFHQLVLTKFLELSSLKEEYNSTITHKKRIEIELDEKIKKNEIIAEKLKNYQIAKEKELKNKKEKKSFSSRSEVEKFISKFSHKYSLQLHTIGRIEKVEKTNYTSFSYRISGDFAKFIKFFTEIENSELKISFDKSPFILNLKTPSFFEGKIMAEIDKKVGISPKINDEKILLQDLKSVEILTIKKVTYNEKKYLFIHYIDGSLLLLANNEKIKINEKPFTVNLDGEEILLKSLR